MDCYGDFLWKFLDIIKGVITILERLTPAPRERKEGKRKAAMVTRPDCGD